MLVTLWLFKTVGSVFCPRLSRSDVSEPHSKWGHARYFHLFVSVHLYLFCHRRVTVNQNYLLLFSSSVCQAGCTVTLYRFQQDTDYSLWRCCFIKLFMLSFFFCPLKWNIDKRYNKRKNYLMLNINININIKYYILIIVKLVLLRCLPDTVCFLK